MPSMREVRRASLSKPIDSPRAALLTSSLAMSGS